MPVATYDDVLAIERVPLAERNIPPTPYAMLMAGAAIAPAAPALTFFAEASRFEDATVWSHRELSRRITQAGNLFRRLRSRARRRGRRPAAESAGNAPRHMGRGSRGRRLRHQPASGDGAIGGPPEGGRAETSGDAHSGAGDGSLAEGDKSGRGAEGAARRACRRPRARWLP